MRKSGLVEKIALAIFVTITLASMVALILVCNLPYGKTYRFNVTIHGLGSVTETCTLADDGGEVVMKIKMGTETRNETINFAYYVIEGNISMFVTDEDSYTPGEVIEGKIDAFTMVLTRDGETETLYCKENINMRTAAIVVMVFGAVFSAGCLLLIVLGKRSKASGNNKVKTNSAGRKVTNYQKATEPSAAVSLPNENMTYEQRLADIAAKKAALETALAKLRQETSPTK